MSVPITSLYTALIIAVATAILFWVVGARRIDKVPLGDGGSQEVLKRMRSQANLVESAPFLLIAMLLMELNGMPGWFLHGFGIVLVAARVAHPIGMSGRYPNLPLRYYGTVFTVGLLGVAIIALLGQALMN